MHNMKKLLIVLMLLTSSSIYAQNCKLSGVNFSDLDSNQANALISVGAQCQTANKTAFLPVFNAKDMISLCKEKWSKRGVLDQGMFDYCMKQKEDSFQDLNYLLKNSKDIPGLVGILQYAINKWYEKEGWDMVLYEVNGQKDGYLDVEYFMSNGGSEELLQNCKGKWLSNAEPQWDMVIYCLEY
jgi:hypothetical protein